MGRHEDAIRVRQNPYYDHAEVRVDANSLGLDDQPAKLACIDIIRKDSAGKPRRVTAHVELRLGQDGRTLYLSLAAVHRDSDIRREICVRPWVLEDDK